MQLWVLLGELPELGEHGVGLSAFGQEHSVGDGGLQGRGRAGAFSTEGLSREGGAKAHKGADGPGLYGARSGEFRPGVDPYLVHLLLAPGEAEARLDLERAAGYFHVGEACAAVVPGYLIDPGGKFLAPPGEGGKFFKALKKLIYTPELEGAAEEAGKAFAL